MAYALVATGLLARPVLTSHKQMDMLEGRIRFRYIPYIQAAPCAIIQISQFQQALQELENTSQANRAMIEILGNLRHNSPANS